MTEQQHEDIVDEFLEDAGTLFGSVIAHMRDHNPRKFGKLMMSIFPVKAEETPSRISIMAQRGGSEDE